MAVVLSLILTASPGGMRNTSREFVLLLILQFFLIFKNVTLSPHWSHYLCYVSFIAFLWSYVWFDIFGVSFLNLSTSIISSRLSVRCSSFPRPSQQTLLGHLFILWFWTYLQNRLKFEFFCVIVLIMNVKKFVIVLCILLMRFLTPTI